MPMGLPAGRRVPRGRLRWYLVHVPEGREQAICEKVRNLVSPEYLEDAFVMFKERWFRRQGDWSLQPIQMYREYFFVATRDVVGLDKELSRLSFPARIAGSAEHAYIPLSPDAQTWFQAAMDDDHTLRNSVAVVVNGELQVQEGPLVGQETRVHRVDRHHRRCQVDVCGGGFTELMALDIPFKS